MSNELNMFYKGEYVSGLGPAHNFELDNYIELDYNNIKEEYDRFTSRMGKNMIKNVSYCPKDKEEMEEMVEDFLDDMDHFAETMQRFGKMFLLSYMAEDEGVGFKTDNEQDQEHFKVYPDCESIKNREKLEQWMSENK